MAKQKKSKASTGNRERLNPLTGKLESVPGTKAGKKRTRTAPGDPLRTHVSLDKKSSKGSKSKSK
jgi:hypothetical protein